MLNINLMNVENLSMGIKRYVWVLYIFLIIGNAFMGAHLTNMIIGHTLFKPSIMPFIPEVKTPKERYVDLKRKDYSAILDRNIFNSIVEDMDELGAVPEIDIAEENIEETPLNLRLRGTVVNENPRYSFAIIEDKKGRDSKLGIYYIGDSVQDKAVVKKIERKRVFLERGGKIEVLKLFEDNEVIKKLLPSSHAKVKKRRKRRSEDIGIRAVSESSYILDQEEVDKALSNLSNLLTQARVVPHFKKGKPDGFRIFAIRPNSLFQKIGLKNGDILKRINGLDITTTEDALAAFQSLRNETNLTLDLERDKERFTFDYTIR